MLNRKQIFDALTDDGKIDVAGTEAQRIINRLMDLQSQHDGKPIVSGSLPPAGSDEDLAIQVTAQFTGTSRGLSIEKKGFIKGALWMRERIGGNNR